MSEWFREGIVSGRVPRGTARLRGEMANWPFDNGEGQFLVQANIRDAIVVYQPKWPQAEIIEADLVIENMSLRSNRSHVINAGNVIRDARVGIEDFRNPFFTINADATGTLESLRQLSINSPIGEMFGGQLDKIAVSGDAALNLDLVVPVRDWESFSFTASLQAQNGSLQMEGFNAPLTDMNGNVTIERFDIASDNLTATFLGNPVYVELSQAPESMPQYRVIADATGRATAEALETELGLPIADRVTGESGFSARLLFPRGKVDEPSPFTIQIASTLEGFAVDLPRPLGKPAGQAVDFGASIFLPKGGELVETTGVAGDIFSWQVAVTKREDAWDIDRGVVTFGVEAESQPVPETRGLHLRGNTDYVHVKRWF